ncbi:MAG TPA: hypothetical protein VK162_16040 [Streptosporangiaceae bacterium]|nr:hypothetical protein [Streptosporangiaceae bacterium]
MSVPSSAGQGTPAAAGQGTPPPAGQDATVAAGQDAPRPAAGVFALLADGTTAEIRAAGRDWAPNHSGNRPIP